MSTLARAWTGLAVLVPAQGAHHVHQVQRRADGTLGVVLAGHRRAPDGHHGVADELLDRAAVPVDDLAREVEVARQELPDGLRVAVLGEAGETDADPRTGPTPGAAPRPPMPGRPRHRGRRGHALAGPSAPPHSPQNRATGSLGVPHAGQVDLQPGPQDRQNFRPASLPVPQAGQVIRDLGLTMRHRRRRRPSAQRSAATCHGGDDMHHRAGPTAVVQLRPLRRSRRR